MDLSRKPMSTRQASFWISGQLSELTGKEIPFVNVATVRQCCREVDRLKDGTVLFEPKPDFDQFISQLVEPAKKFATLHH